MGINSVRAEVQHVCNLPGDVAFDNQLNDFDLAGRKQRGRTVRRGSAQAFFEQYIQNFGTKKLVAFSGGPHGIRDFLFVAGFGQKAEHAVFQYPENGVFVVVVADGQDAQIGIAGCHDGNDLPTKMPGRIVVYDEHVGALCFQLLEQLLHVGRFAHYLYVGLL